jgi:hypothetical protein
LLAKQQFQPRALRMVSKQAASSSSELEEVACLLNLMRYVTYQCARLAPAQHAQEHTLTC